MVTEVKNLFWRGWSFSFLSFPGDGMLGFFFCTRLRGPQLGQVSLAVLANPGLDGHEFGNVARYAALQDRTVASDHVLGHDFGVVGLRNNCDRTI